MSTQRTRSAFIEQRNHLDPNRARHRESLVWVVPRVAPGITAFVYTWVNSQGLAGAALSVFGEKVGEQIFEKVDNIQIPDEMDFSDYRVGPFSMLVDGDGMCSTVQFQGERVSLELEFQGLHSPYEYGNHPEGCPEFFADNRLEQSGRAKGWLDVNGSRISFNEMCQRDHSWGERDWDAMHHMKWVNALGDDVAVHAVELLAYGQRYLRGYIFADGRCVQLRDLYLKYKLDENLLHQEMSSLWVEAEGREVRVTFTNGGPHFVWKVHENFTLRDTAFDAEIDGHAAIAYVDMSWDPDYMRRTIDKHSTPLSVSQ